MVIYNLFKSIILINLCITYVCQNLDLSSQSSWSVSNIGYSFQSESAMALLLSEATCNSFVDCAQICHKNMLCRIFNYDHQLKICRLFEGDSKTMGAVYPDYGSISLQTASIELAPNLFNAYGEACSACDNSRYLMCTNNQCSCPPKTYFHGNICRSCKLLGSHCINENECRNDLNYTCLGRQQCGRE